MYICMYAILIQCTALTDQVWPESWKMQHLDRGTKCIRGFWNDFGGRTPCQHSNGGTMLTFTDEK